MIALAVSVLGLLPPQEASSQIATAQDIWLEPSSPLPGVEARVYYQYRNNSSSSAVYDRRVTIYAPGGSIAERNEQDDDAFGGSEAKRRYLSHTFGNGTYLIRAEIFDRYASESGWPSSRRIHYRQESFTIGSATSSRLTVRVGSGKWSGDMEVQLFRVSSSGWELLEQDLSSSRDRDFGDQLFGDYALLAYQGAMQIAARSFNFSSSTSTPVSLPLSTKRDLEVTALYSDGTTPFPGVELRLFDNAGVERYRQTTGSDGTTTFRTFPNIDEQETESYTIEAWYGGSEVGGAANVRVNDSSSPTTWNAQTNVGAGKDLTVELSSGKWDGGVEVQLFDENWTFLDSETGTGRDYDFGRRAFGGYHLLAYQGAILVAERSFTLSSGTDPPVSLPLSTKRDLKVTALYSDGSTRFPGVELRLFDNAGVERYRQTTGSDGTTTFRTFPNIDDQETESYTIEAWYGGSEVGGAANVRVNDSSSPTTWNAQTDVVPSGSIRVEVQESEGRAMSGSELNALLICRDGIELVDRKVDPATNAHTFADLPVGAYRIDAYANDMLVGSYSASVNGDTHSGTITAPARGAVAARVYYSDGRSHLEDVEVQLRSHEEQVWRVGHTSSDRHLVDWNPSPDVTRDTIWPLPNRETGEQWYLVVVSDGQEVGRQAFDLAQGQRWTVHVTTDRVVPIDPDPVPVITDFTVSPSSGAPGDVVTVTMRVRNDGGDARPGGVTISLPEFVDPEISDMVVDTAAPAGRWLIRTSRTGDLIYHRDEGVGEFQSRHLFVDWEVPVWKAGATKEVRLQVELPGRSERLRIWGRSAMRSGSGNQYTNAPVEQRASTLDQQGWPVLSEEVVLSLDLVCDRSRLIKGPGSGASRALVLVPGLGIDPIVDYPEACASWTPTEDRSLSGWDAVYQSEDVLEAFDTYVFDYFRFTAADETGLLLADELTTLSQQYDRITVVGHSNGGIVARAAIAGMPNLLSPVEKLITLGTPHGGAPFTVWGNSLNNAIEFVGYDSPGLAELNSEDIHWDQFLYTLGGHVLAADDEDWSSLPTARDRGAYWWTQYEGKSRYNDGFQGPGGWWISEQQQRGWVPNDFLVSSSSAYPPFSRQQRDGPEDLGFGPGVGHGAAWGVESDVRSHYNDEFRTTIRRLLLPAPRADAQPAVVDIDVGEQVTVDFDVPVTIPASPVAWTVLIDTGDPAGPSVRRVDDLPWTLPADLVSVAQEVQIRTRPVYALDDGDADEDGITDEVKTDGTWSEPVVVRVGLDNAPILEGPQVPVEYGVPFHLSWSSVEGATSYTLQWGPDPTFQAGTMSEVVTGDFVERTIPAQQGATTWYYRIRADNSPYSNEVGVEASRFQQVTIEGQGSGSGWVRSEEAAMGVECLIVDGSASEDVGSCSYRFPEGQEISLVADPNPDGTTFDMWSGACSGKACQVVLDAERSVGVRFLTPPVIELSVDTLRLSAPAGETNAVEGQARVTNGGESPLTGLSISEVAYLDQENDGWLSAELVAEDAPTDLLGVAHATGLGACPSNRRGS